MADWTTFAGFAGVVLGLLLLLARASQDLVHDGDRSDRLDRPDRSDRSRPDHRRSDRPDRPAGDRPDRPDHPDYHDRPDHRRADGDSPRETQRTPAPSGGDSDRFDGDSFDSDRFRPAEAGPRNAASPDPAAPTPPAAQFSTGALLANVALSQGLFGALLLAGAWYAEIPAWAFGASPDAVGPTSLALGIGLGIALYALNEVGASVGDRWGLGRSEELREALAPDTLAGWAVLLLVVLPIIAGFEEFLFRGALVGALSAGFGLSPWLLAVLSSAAFALGHGAQGPAGVVVTGLLGFVLAAAFVLTGSLLVVVVAHYLVNALEFVVHEALDVEWAS
ncbi:CPBP family intramembrane glutamic endopeptidase [Halegenticoccus soli]|uniref:CPBP family intramembrane glutamic endopeptidase n=1 Tax=Halegenticoccus soli TaxID=1985678 RepID=UPI000C6D5510|nr:type II CAAX endopeptidase family protein [Halegenticoccus soli]